MQITDYWHTWYENDTSLVSDYDHSLLTCNHWPHFNKTCVSDTVWERSVSHSAVLKFYLCLLANGNKVFFTVCKREMWWQQWPQSWRSIKSRKQKMPSDVLHGSHPATFCCLMHDRTVNIYCAAADFQAKKNKDNINVMSLTGGLQVHRCY